MKKLLNCGFGYPIGKETLDLIVSLGFDGIRQEVNTDNLAETDTIISEFADKRLFPLIIVGASGREEIPVVVSRALAVEQKCAKYGIRDYAIEVTNEPENTVFYRTNPRGYGTVVRAVCEALPNSQIISGGLMSTSQDAMGYLRIAISMIPRTCAIGIHTYRSSKPDKPLPGYASRQEEFDTLKSIANGRSIWGTEIGWTTAKHGWPCKRGLTDQQVADNLKREKELCGQAGFQSFTVYQWSDGPGNGDLDHFGIRRLDGTLKPSAYVAQTA